MACYNARRQDPVPHSLQISSDGFQFPLQRATVTANFLVIAIGTHSHLLTDNIHIEHEYAEFYFHSRLI